MKPVRTLMGAMLRPYTNALKTLKTSGENIKQSVEGVKETIEKEDGQGDSIKYIDAPDASSAFEAIYQANGWSEEDLKEKSNWLRKSKFLMFGFGWVSLMAMVFFVVYLIKSSIWLTMFLSAAGVSVFIIFILSALKYALFHEQIKQRKLLSLKEFVGSRSFLKNFLL